MDTHTAATTTTETELEMQPVIDRAQLQEVIDELPQFVGKMIEALDPELPRQMCLMRGAVAAADADGLATAAHRLRGSLGCVYATASFRAAGVLEDMGRNGDLTGSQVAFANLERELDRLRDELILVKKELLS